MNYIFRTCVVMLTKDYILYIIYCTPVLSCEGYQVYICNPYTWYGAVVKPPTCIRVPVLGCEVDHGLPVAAGHC